MLEANQTTTEEIQPAISDLKLIPLIPTKNAQNGAIYSKHLTDAISNDDVYNIALTGGYGSGKTSVIETFLNSFPEKPQKSEKKNVIRISLAAFNFDVKDDKVEEKTKRWPRVLGVNSDETNDQIQLEISLLQQFLFQSKSWEKSSTGNVLNRISLHWKIGISISLLIASILSFQILWNPYLLVKWFQIQTVDSISNSGWINFFSLIALLITFIWVSYNSFWIIKNFKATKIDLKPIVLEVASTNEKISVLNNYLFEIVKFFRNEKVNIVILEDIDRLETHDLFEKLREINNILRLNPDTKELKVKFIYSIKESVFKNEKEKNKFFDLIIPIVPYINNQNSKDKLKEYISKVEPKMNSKLYEVIQIASFCIDDMRTIANISNEYNIYKSVTGTSDLAPEKLLAIVIYKNIFPTDFEKIHSGNSFLQKVFNQTDELIRKKKQHLTKQLETINDEQIEVQEEKKKDVFELREQYLMEFIKKLHVNENFLLNDTHYPYKDLLEDEQFGEIIKKGLSTDKGRSFKFSDIESEISKTLKFEMRVKTIENKTQQARSLIEANKKDIQAQLARIDSFPFSKLIDGESLIIEKDLGCETEKHSSDQFRLKFVETMLSKGYITPDYKYWISIFHEGSFTNADRNFIFSIKNKRSLPFETKIDNPEAIAVDLMPDDWASLAILNFDFFNQVIKHSEHKKKVLAVYDNMNQNTEQSLKFIYEFFEITTLKKTFITQVMSFWNSFILTANSSIHDIVQFVPYILLYCDTDTIKSQNSNGVLADKINTDANLISVLSSDKFKKEKLNQLKQNVKTMDLKLLELNFEKKNPILDVFYELSAYELNMLNIKLINQVYAETSEYTYSSILNSNMTHLKEYIKKNLNEFLDDVLLPASEQIENWMEDKNVVIAMLNNDDISEETKESFIKAVHFEKLNFSDLETTDQYNTLIENDRIVGSWKNFSEYIIDCEEIDDYFIILINNEKWINEFKLLKDSGIEKATIEPILIQLMSHEIHSKALEKLLRKYAFVLSIAFITEDSLAQNLRVGINIGYFQFSLEIYNHLKNTHSDENVHLTYALKFQDKFLENIDEAIFSFTKTELIFILNEAGFKNDFTYKALIKSATAIKSFNSSESIFLMKSILKIGKLTSFSLLSEALKILPESEQVSFFNKIHESTKLTPEVPIALLNYLKGNLEHVSKSLWPITMSLNDENMTFAENLVQLNVIKSTKDIVKGDKIKFKTKKNS